MKDSVFVCTKCGAEDSISELVTVEGWRAVEIVEQDGKPKASWSREHEVDWDTVDRYAYHCSECDRQFPTLQAAVRVKPRVECRDCGFDGEPEDHPEECGGELLGLDPPAVHPDQVALEIAA